MVGDGKKINVAIYVRVSTEEQAKEGYSLKAQLDSLRHYAIARNWNIVKEYIDDGYSGRTTRREGYLQMIREKALWDILLVKKMDRIHRNIKNFMFMMDELEKSNKQFVSAEESLDTSTAIGRFVVYIIQGIAQLESEQIGERVYDGMAQKAKSNGGYLGFNIPYGYNYENGKLVINPNECATVKLIYKLYLEGYSLASIVNKLTNLGIPTKRFRKWAKKTISAILKNPLYAGYFVWDSIVQNGTHEPIISKNHFIEVQNIFKKKMHKYCELCLE